MITIGIPTYERPRGLERAVRAALAQTHRDIEILISDNASPSPAVSRVLTELERSDPRVRVLRNGENRGTYGNQLRLLRAARGEWFLLLADDDVIDPDYLATLHARARRGDASITVGSLRFLSAESSERELDFGRAVTMAVDFGALARPDPAQRIRCFFDRGEGLYAHLIYGLVRRELFLRAFEIVDPDPDQDTPTYLDTYIVFLLVASGPVAFVPGSARTTIDHPQRLTHTTVAPPSYRPSLWDGYWTLAHHRDHLQRFALPSETSVRILAELQARMRRAPFTALWRRGEGLGVRLMRRLGLHDTYRAVKRRFGRR